jgi:hypothetical protein
MHPEYYAHRHWNLGGEVTSALRRKRLQGALGALFAALLSTSLSSSAYTQTVAPPSRPSPPDHRVNRILVLDASGSMWNNVSDASSPRRAELAAKFVDLFATQLAGESVQRTLGMIRLGYQYPWLGGANSKEKLCSDVEVVVKPAIASQVRGQVAFESGVGRKMTADDYNPKGYTPLRLAIERAADAAPPEGATLVVVTDLDSKDTNCEDPCINGKPIPELQALLDRRHIRIRYVIAAGLIGAIGERARQFAACFGAEYRLLDDLGAAERIGTEVGLKLIDETPLPVSTRGSISLELQDASGQKVPTPPGSQLDVRRSKSSTSILRAPGQQVTDAGSYEATLSFGGRKWPVDAVVSADRRTDIAYVIADGILRITLVDSDFRPIDKGSDIVWEIRPASGTTTQPTRLKGPRMNQVLPVGRYHVSIYTNTATVQKDVTVDAGQESNIEIQVQNE